MNNNHAILISIYLFLSLGAIAEEQKSPVLIEADQVTHNRDKNEILYQGNVVISQDTLQIKSDRLLIRTEKDKFIFIKATGNPVRFQQNINKAISGRADIIEYQIEKKILMLVGNALVARKGESIKATQISYNLEEGSISAIGGGKPENRVKTIFKLPESFPKTKQPVANNGTDK